MGVRIYDKAAAAADTTICLLFVPLIVFCLFLIFVSNILRRLSKIRVISSLSFRFIRG